MLAWKQPFIQRVRNSSLVKRPRVDNTRACKLAAEDMDSVFKGRMVGEHSVRCRSRGASHGGAIGKANVGISNDKEGAKPSRRKTKGS